MQTINPAYLTETKILNFNNKNITALVQKQGWRSLSDYEKIGTIYDFVRNSISFGYNVSDNITASEVLFDGYGQCNTKGTLLMALLRAVSIPCRIHGFTIHKSLQRGVVPELVYPITPDNILHSWVEVFYDNRWIYLEGFILDDEYLTSLQKGFNNTNLGLCSYGVGTENLSKLQINWCGDDTFIQKTGINQDLGVFATPDEFYAKYHQNFSLWKRWFYQNIVRHWMNSRVKQMRKGKMLPTNFQSPLKEDNWKHVIKAN